MTEDRSAYDRRMKFTPAFSDTKNQFGGEIPIAKRQAVIIINGHVLRNQDEADMAFRDGLIDFPVTFGGGLGG